MLPTVVQLTAETLLATGVGPEPAHVLQPAALNALEACSKAVSRQRTLSRQPTPELQPPTADELLALLRPAVTRLLTEQHGFTPTMATAILEAGILQDPPL
ncbi:hypothetical protein [Streptomyces phaeochromogenes]